MRVSVSSPAFHIYYHTIDNWIKNTWRCINVFSMILKMSDDPIWQML